MNNIPLNQLVHTHDYNHHSLMPLLNFLVKKQIIYQDNILVNMKESQWNLYYDKNLLISLKTHQNGYKMGYKLIIPNIKEPIHIQSLHDIQDDIGTHYYWRRLIDNTEDVSISLAKVLEYKNKLKSEDFYNWIAKTNIMRFSSNQDEYLIPLKDTIPILAKMVKLEILNPEKVSLYSSNKYEVEVLNQDNPHQCLFTLEKESKNGFVINLANYNEGDDFSVIDGNIYSFNNFKEFQDDMATQKTLKKHCDVNAKNNKKNTFKP